MSSSMAMEDYSAWKYDTESQETLFVESPNSLEVDVSEDEGPFFDIDFAVPFYCDARDCSPCTDEESEEENGEEFEFNFSVSSSSNQSNRNQCCMDSSPADNLFYKGQLLPLQVNPKEEMVSKVEVDGGKGGSLLSGNVNGIKTHFPALLKTATKLKVSLFGLKKTAKVGMDMQAECGSGVDSPVQKQNKFFTVKFKVVDVPLVSLFTRDNSKGPKRDETTCEDVEGDSKGNDRKKAKEIVQKYVKMIRPLYVKISQKYNEKNKHADLEKCGVGNGGNNARVSGSERSQNQVSFSGNLKMVYKHFGKGRNSQASNVKPVLPNYCSESTMMELQSAIQGAIAHCKQSNSSDDAPNSSGSESSP